MARPRKMTTEQMIEVVDSYLMYVEGNGGLLKCSLIAEHASQLGYNADGYDFRRNTAVREHIDRLKEDRERSVGNVPLVYKNLDIEGLIRHNGKADRLVKALAELDTYWKKVSEHASLMAKQNQMLIKTKMDRESDLKDAIAAQEKLSSDYAELSTRNNKLSAENRYLKKTLRTYLYPAVANEILIRENVLKEADTNVTEAAVRDMAEFSAPRSLRESVASDLAVLSAEEQLLAKMWEACDE